jgi:uncharacterized membrane protein YfcA/uncharacterized membrane protein YedE/YeeE
MILTLSLSVLIGLSLGLLGGGGSILTLPILVYAAGLDPKAAIASSQLVVGLASLAAVFTHARAGRVEWRTALIFGSAGMATAYGAGRVAAFIPGTVLLLLFTVVMGVTAVAMLRPVRPRSAAMSVGRAVACGAAVGAVTGLIGAGGGFVVVPALVLLGGLSMGSAVGTSLVVIALNQFAGLAGHLGHATLDWALAGQVAAAAVAGSLVGGRLAGRVPPQALRQAFGWFTLLMALFMLGRELPPAVTGSAAWRGVFVDRWPWYVGGAAIGALVLLLLWSENRLLGVSTGYAELCRMPSDPAARRSWRPPFLVGIVLGGMASGLLGGMRPTFTLGAFDALVSTPALRAPVLIGAGTLIGYGARAAGGCTSGHSIVGVAQLARSSLAATAAFMVGGFATTWLLVLALGRTA